MIARPLARLGLALFPELDRSPSLVVIPAKVGIHEHRPLKAA